MPVRAPYAFVPLSDKVFFPDWADLVSHDVPFKDGWCGEVEIEINTVTPLVVGAERNRLSNGGGDVRPFCLPGGPYAIPGSSLQGMIRNVLEIATFGRIGPFMDKRELRMPNNKKSDTCRFLEKRLAHVCSELDLPALLFGEVAGNAGGLRRRVAFDSAVFDESVKPVQENGRRILAEPKQTYWPCYLRKDSGQYQLSGWKQFPATKGRASPHIPQALLNKPKIQTQLWTLPAEKIARAALRFHNLRSCEFGAVLWALTWGGESWRRDDGSTRPLRHRLGMGKAFGLGHVEISIARVTAIPNAPHNGQIKANGDGCAEATRPWMDDFMAVMDQFVGPDAGGWRRTEQVATLLAMADPACVGDRPLTHMNLNEFARAKREGYFLPPYPTRPVPPSAND